MGSFPHIRSLPYRIELLKEFDHSFWGRTVRNSHFRRPSIKLVRSNRRRKGVLRPFRPVAGLRSLFLAPFCPLLQQPFVPRPLSDWKKAGLQYVNCRTIPGQYRSALFMDHRSLQDVFGNVRCWKLIAYFIMLHKLNNNKLKTWYMLKLWMVQWIDRTLPIDSEVLDIEKIFFRYCKCYTAHMKDKSFRNNFRYVPLGWIERERFHILLHQNEKFFCVLLLRTRNIQSCFSKRQSKPLFSNPRSRDKSSQQDRFQFI